MYTLLYVDTYFNRINGDVTWENSGNPTSRLVKYDATTTFKTSTWYQFSQSHKPNTDMIMYSIPSGNLTKLWKMAIEIVCLSFKSGDCPKFFVC